MGHEQLLFNYFENVSNECGMNCIQVHILNRWTAAYD